MPAPHHSVFYRPDALPPFVSVSVTCLVYLLLLFVLCYLYTGTVILRVAIFPLFIYVQKQMVVINNHMPIVQKMQEQLAKARRSGDILEGEIVGVICLLLL